MHALSRGVDGVFVKIEVLRYLLDILTSVGGLSTLPMAGFSSAVSPYGYNTASAVGRAAAGAGRLFIRICRADRPGESPHAEAPSRTQTSRPRRGPLTECTHAPPRRQLLPPTRVANRLQRCAMTNHDRNSSGRVLGRRKPAGGRGALLDARGLGGCDCTVPCQCRSE